MYDVHFLCLFENIFETSKHLEEFLTSFSEQNTLAFQVLWLIVHVNNDIRACKTLKRWLPMAPTTQHLLQAGGLKIMFGRFLGSTLEITVQFFHRFHKTVVC